MVASGSLDRVRADATEMQQVTEQPTLAAASNHAAPQPTLPEDTVSISGAARELSQSTSTLVRLLNADGESVELIAAQLDVTPQSVQTYLGRDALAATA
jgi:DNA-directed RNA polymerase specialized sigma24 family protein